MRRWLRVLFVGVLALLVSIDSASACRFLRSRCRPRCRTVACHRPRPSACHPAHAVVHCPPADCSPCAAPDEMISIGTPQCCVPSDGSAHAEIVEPLHGAVVESAIQSTPPAETPTTVVEKPVPAMPPAAVEKPMPAPLAPVPVAPASAEQPLPAPQFKTAKEILEESAATQAAEAKAEAEAKAAAEPKTPAEAKAADEVLAEEEATKPVAEKPAAKPAEAPVEEPLEEEAVEEKPAPKKAAEEEPAEEEENLFDEPDAEAEEKAKPAAEDPADAPAEEKPEEPKAEDDPFASILRAPSEPVRRWIDNTGRHETIGRLVEVHPDHIRILKANGRHSMVPLTRLSRHDQDYVNTTGARIAAERRSQPAVHDTAGL